MKRVILTSLMLAACMVAGAQSFTVKNLKYKVNGTGTVALTGCSSQLSGIVQIPDKVSNGGTEYRVNVIKERAFVGQTLFTAVYLPQEVDTIGQDAFYGCTGLIVATGLKKVDVCEAYAFAKTSLAQIKWDNVEMNSLGAGAFADCPKLRTIELPATLKKLPEGLLSGCTALTALQIGAAVESIDNRAFADCSALTTVTLPESVTTLGDEVFAEMTSLTEIQMPDGITKMGASVFRGCTSLTAMTLPASLTTMGYGTFIGCTALKEVTLPSRLREIDDKFAFADCPSLEKIEINSGLYYKSIDGVLYNMTGNKIIAYPAALSKTVHPTIKATTQPFAPGALIGCEMDRNLTLPAQLRTLPREVMANTTGLRAILLSTRSSLIGIEERAFAHSKDLTYVFLPSTLKTIDNAAFEGDDGLVDVIARMGTPPVITDWTFSETAYKQTVLHTPTGKTEIYAQADGWKKFEQMMDDAATEVETLEEQGAKENETTYNLQGIRVEKPLRGVYVRGGKKIVY